METRKEGNKYSFGIGIFLFMTFGLQSTKLKKEGKI